MASLFKTGVSSNPGPAFLLGNNHQSLEAASAFKCPCTLL